MNKFKVFDSNAKKWLDPKGFYINSAGELCKFDRPVICKVLEHVIPVFGTGKIDLNGVELFDGDKLIDGHIIMNIDGLWAASKYGSAGTVLYRLDKEKLIKTGSKYEEQ